MAADPPASRPEWVPPCLCHVSPISAGFQLTLYFQTGQTWPYIRSLLQTGSGELWIQATAHSFVRHRYSFSMDLLGLGLFNFYTLFSKRLASCQLLGHEQINKVSDTYASKQISAGYLSKQIFAGYRTPQNKFLRCIILL